MYIRHLTPAHWDFAPASLPCPLQLGKARQHDTAKNERPLLTEIIVGTMEVCSSTDGYLSMIHSLDRAARTATWFWGHLGE